MIARGLKTHWLVWEMPEPEKTPSRKPTFVDVQMPAAGYIPPPIAHICLNAGYRLHVTFQFSLPSSFLLKRDGAI